MGERHIIAFGHENVRFYFRAAAIVLHDGRVLLHRADYEDFWSLPGGRVEMMEPSEQAIVRELQEELEVEAEVERLVWVAESFFDFQGKSYHELGLYYLVSVPADWPVLQESGPFWREEPSGVNILFRWFNLAELAGVRTNPGFLSRGLLALPQNIEHVTTEHAIYGG